MMARNHDSAYSTASWIFLMVWECSDWFFRENGLNDEIDIVFDDGKEIRGKKMCKGWYI